MHVLVTGAGGFSGAEITSALLRCGHHVTACVGSALGRLAPDVEKHGRLTIITGDLAGSIRLPARVEAIVHTAARSPLAGVTTDNLVRDNVFVTQRLIKYAKEAGAHTFIYFSSLSIYGQIDASIVDETTPVRDPDIYGMTKRLGEELLSEQKSSMRSLAIRLPGIIGRGSVRNWLTKVLAAARDGSEVVIFNPDALFNNAVHVADLGRFTCNLLDQEWQGFDVVTIGASGEMTVGAVVRFIVDAFGGQTEIRIRAGSERSFLISSVHAHEKYGYHPADITGMLHRFVAENM